jgi:hypothetical protein
MLQVLVVKKWIHEEPLGKQNIHFVCTFDSCSTNFWLASSFCRHLQCILAAVFRYPTCWYCSVIELSLDFGFWSWVENLGHNIKKKWHQNAMCSNPRNIYVGFARGLHRAGQVCLKHQVTIQMLRVVLHLTLNHGCICKTPNKLAKADQTRQYW